MLMINIFQALLERDVKFQDRVINGGIIRSRRPVEDGELAAAARTQVTDGPIFKNETLARWLKEPPQDECKSSTMISPKEDAF